MGCRDAVERVFAEFRESDLDTIVWSHEGISSRAFSLDTSYIQPLIQGFDVKIFLYVRYVDEWIESLFKERIRAQGGRGRGRIERRKPKANPRPLTPLTPQPAADTRQAKSMLEEGSDIPASLRALQESLRSAEIVVRSYDAHRERGTVVSGALAAMGLPVASAFRDADDDAGVHNPTKSNLYSMLLYHLVMGEADAEVVRAVTKATSKRERQSVEFEPMNGRRFRFLSEENILDARGYYEELRHEYPHLPVQPPYAPDRAERCLPKADGIALLDWLRPDISDAVFEEARAAYKLI